MVVDGKTKAIICETKKDLDNDCTYCTASIQCGTNLSVFWVTLIKQKIYADQYNVTRLWPDLIPVVFPNYARGDDERKNISKRFDEIKLIRNRLFHHEPIWKFKRANSPEECIAELRSKFNDVFKAIGWISSYKRNCLREFGFVESFRANCTLEILEHFKTRGEKIMKEIVAFDKQPLLAVSP